MPLFRIILPYKYARLFGELELDCPHLTVDWCRICRADHCIADVLRTSLLVGVHFVRVIAWRGRSQCSDAFLTHSVTNNSETARKLTRASVSSLYCPQDREVNALLVPTTPGPAVTMGAVVYSRIPESLWECASTLDSSEVSDCAYVAVVEA